MTESKIFPWASTHYSVGDEVEYVTKNKNEEEKIEKAIVSDVSEYFLMLTINPIEGYDLNEHEGIHIIVRDPYKIRHRKIQ